MKKKILLVYYSRSGNTKKIAEEIAKEIGVDIDEIIDLKDRKRIILGWIISGKDASQKKLTEIKFKKTPSKYDLVAIGTPVWAWTMTPAIRTYLHQNKNKFKKVAFFSTCGSLKNKAFSDMGCLSKKPIATLAISEKELHLNNYKEKLNEFCKKLK